MRVLVSGTSRALLGAAAVLATVAVLGLSSGCREKKAPPIDPRTIALVNGEIITRGTFEKKLQEEVQSVDAVEPRSPEQIEPMRRALLDDLVNRALLLQEAHRLNIAPTPEEVDRRVLRMSADFASVQGFDEALAQGQISQPELKRETAELLAIEKLFGEHVYPRVAVTEEEIRQYYEEHKEDFSVPEEVHALQIVVKSLEEARRIQSLLRQGKKFPDLARKYSLSADARVGGDLGFFPRGQMPPAFDEVAFKLAVGQVSDVVTTDYGFHLFKVLERRPAQKRELIDVRAAVESKLLKLKRAQAERTHLAQLRQQATIIINEPVLQTVTGHPQPPL